MMLGHAHLPGWKLAELRFFRDEAFLDDASFDDPWYMLA